MQALCGAPRAPVLAKATASSAGTKSNTRMMVAPAANAKAGSLNQSSFVGSKLTMPSTKASVHARKSAVVTKAMADGDKPKKVVLAYR